MREKRRCPECNQWLMSDETTCDCGCKIETKTQVNADHNCHYQVNLKGCPLPGSVSSALHGSKTWHCTKHHQNLDDPKRCYEIWLEAITNYETIMDDYIDWRVKLYPEKYLEAQNKIKLEAQQLRAKGVIN